MEWREKNNYFLKNQIDKFILLCYNIFEVKGRKKGP